MKLKISVMGGATGLVSRNVLDKATGSAVRSRTTLGWNTIVAQEGQSVELEQ